MAVVEHFRARKTSAAEVAPDDTESFEAFFREHHARLFGALCIATGDGLEAEELMQEAFVRVLSRWHRVREHPDPPGYLYRTAFNLFRDRKRMAMVAARRRVGMRLPDDAFARIDEREAVIHALRGLSPRQRAAIVLLELLDMNSQEASELLGVQPSTVRTLASQARAVLRRSLEATDE
jgi:RNA polymerase sigma-70 factor (ECF subfamily)